MADDPERGAVTIVNETGLPDVEVEEAVETFWTEQSSLAGIANSFQTYATQGQGSLLTRGKFTPPSNVAEEIALARDMIDRDDACGAVMGQMLAVAFGDGMQHLHKDETTVGLFNEVAKSADLDALFQEMYREYLIAGSVTTVGLYSRELLSFTPEGKSTTKVEKQIAVPHVGVIHAEDIRLLDDDTFGTADLFYLPCKDEQRRWLEEWFKEGTSAGRKAEMRREYPVWAQLYVEQRRAPNDVDLFADTMYVYRLNPKMVRRSTMPKGSQPYPRPPLTGNFALLEAKRLLNIMDYALLQGGTNYIVIAKKGSEKQPAKPAEVANLYNVVRGASRTGVLVGDHRLNLEIVTPNLDELLNPGKRALLDRKLAQRLMRVADRPTLDPGVEGARSDMELLARVVTADRRHLRRHIGLIYDDVVKRNRSTFTKGSPGIWFPKIVLTGLDAFNQQVLKLRDRGDIPRKWAVEAAGYDYEASVEQRRREIENGDDEVLTPGDVPFSTNGAPPEGGRPAGGSPANGAPNSKPPARSSSPASPGTQRQRSRGETVRAWHDEESGEVLRVGESTYGILEEFAATRTVGRLTSLEQKALEATETVQEGPLIVVPVNPGYACAEYRAVRLGDGGVSILIGRRKLDSAVVAKALCFRDTQHTLAEAEDRAMRWGFPVEPKQDEPEKKLWVPGDPAPTETAQVPLTLVVNAADGKTLVRKRVVRGDNGEIIETVEEPVE